MLQQMLTDHSPKKNLYFQQARVGDLLGWMPGKYAMFVYERGNEFLEQYFNGDEYAVSRITRRHQFWAWWKNMWSYRDEVYLHDIDGREDELSLDTRTKIYSALHNAGILASELTIPSWIYPPDFPVIKMQMV